MISKKTRLRSFVRSSSGLTNRRLKISIRDFEPLKIIGRGAYGEVRLCKWISSGELVAIKKMKKRDMIKKNEIEHLRAERTVLSKSSNIWIIDLKCSFQDDDFLYLVMEYLPGGDLMNLLIKKDIFTLDEARFYIAETIVAVEYVHTLGYVHRDIKPDNILLDSQGHIKLTDFGLCTSMVLGDYSRKAETNPTKKAVHKRITKNKSQTTKRTERKCIHWLALQTTSHQKSSTALVIQRASTGGQSAPYSSKCWLAMPLFAQTIPRKPAARWCNGGNICTFQPTCR